jgi:6-phosphogluconolactonase
MDMPEDGHGPHAIRRRLLVSSASLATMAAIRPELAAAAALDATESPAKGPAMYAYVGSRTTRERNARGDGITIFRVDQDSGSLERIQVVGDLVNPSYLTLNADGSRLYTVHGDEMEVSAFAVDKSTGQLRFLNRQSTRGKNPVHLAIDPSGRFLVVTNHIGASLAVLPLRADGSLGEVTQLVEFSGPIGPHRIEQKQAKPHFNPYDPSGRFIVVPDKGLDRVFTFRFDGGQLTPATTPFVAAREGAGPRHVAFHPTKPLAYVVNELDSTVTTYRFDRATGALDPVEILSTLPSTFTGNSRAAGIAMDAQGRTVYASNRGHDSIAVFRVDPASGRLTFAGADTTLGKTPRFFTLSPNGATLFALNEDSDAIVALRVDRETGRLSSLQAPVKCGSPVCMVFSS